MDQKIGAGPDSSSDIEVEAHSTGVMTVPGVLSIKLVIAARALVIEVVLAARTLVIEVVLAASAQSCLDRW
jgi:hypothetical protein